MNKLTTAAMVGAMTMMSALQGQEVNIAGRSVQVHGFASQGFAYSNQNNYLSMKTSEGSFAFTDAGLNVSTRILSNFRVGAQVYTRNIGQLGNGRVSIDWATADYQFNEFFGVRAGKVKTAFGLYNDSQDVAFLHTWAILPQSLYPLDLRGTNIAHTGADLYGSIPIKKLGTMSYTVYAGQTPEDPTGGYAFGLSQSNIRIKSYGGRVTGGDLRWATGINGLTVGASYIDQHIVGDGTRPVTAAHKQGIFHEESAKNYMYQYYTQYVRGGLRLDGEYRRFWRDQNVLNLGSRSTDNRGWYIAGSYRLLKQLEVGSYWSQYSNWLVNTSLPQNHLYDKVVTAKVDVTNYWNIKVEGHFIDGHNSAVVTGLAGFYVSANPKGLMPTTNMLVIRTGLNF
jgi:hypothetical protein